MNRDASEQRGWLRWVIPVVIVAVGVGVALSMVAARPEVPATTPPSPLRRVTVTTVHHESLEHEVEAYGTVQPRTETTLVAEVAGRVVTVHPAFRAGGFVAAGDVLVKLDDSIHRATLATREADVARAQAALSRERAEAELAAKEWQQFGSGEPSDLVLRKPQLAEAEAALKAGQAALARARIDLERTQITAPYAARIRERFVEEGRFLAVGTPVARIYATDFAEVRLPITLDELAYLDLPLTAGIDEVATNGDSDPSSAPVELSCDIGGRLAHWPARIMRTEGEVDPRSRVLHAIARVDDPYHRQSASDSPPLIVGLFVRAAIRGKPAPDVAVLPRAALRQGNHVYVIHQDGTLEVRKVDVLRLRERDVWIDGKLADGERICTSRLDLAVDGMTVRVVDSEIAPNRHGSASR